MRKLVQLLYFGYSHLAVNRVSRGELARRLHRVGIFFVYQHETAVLLPILLARSRIA
jgi:hypothetical protein